MNKRNLLVTLADKNYILQARQLFSSVYWNAGWDGDYMLMAHDVAEEDLQWFRNKGFLIKECKNLYHGKMGYREYSTSVLDKFYLFTEEFKKWEHVVFLDGDMIVRANIDRLTRTNSFSSPKTCKDYFKYYFAKSEGPELAMLEKEYNLKRPAFNSGVMCYNTQIIKDHTFDDLLAVFYKYANICESDDAILNLYFYRQWTKIPMVFNVLVHNFGLKNYNNAIILHFNKPANFRDKNLRPWEEGNHYYNEWKANLDKAELMDLQKVQAGKKWGFFKINYYSLLLNLWIYLNIIIQKLQGFYHDFFKNYLKYRVRYLFLYTIQTPGRIAGTIGQYIKKRNPGLYNRFKTKR